MGQSNPANCQHSSPPRVGVQVLRTAERRDRYKREVDIIETLRTKGDALVMKKTMIAVAGERLAEPKVILESYPLGAETR